MLEQVDGSAFLAELNNNIGYHHTPNTKHLMRIHKHFIYPQFLI